MLRRVSQYVVGSFVEPRLLDGFPQSCLHKGVDVEVVRNKLCTIPVSWCCVLWKCVAVAKLMFLQGVLPVHVENLEEALRMEPIARKQRQVFRNFLKEFVIGKDIPNSGELALKIRNLAEKLGTEIPI